MCALSSSIPGGSLAPTTVHPASVQQYNSTSSSKSLDGFEPICDKLGVRPTSSSKYDMALSLQAHRAHQQLRLTQQNALIVLKMQFDATSNVLMLATGYATGYALCNRHSMAQWLYRAAMLALAAVLYVLHDSTPNHPFEIVPLLAINVLVDVYDQHTDAISVLNRTMVVAIIARLYGVAEDNWVFATAYAFAFAAVHLVAHGPVPAANALAMYLACIMPQPALPFEAFLRVLGACVVMYIHRNLPVPLQPYTVVHFFIAPWPVACIVAAYQIAQKCYKVYSQDSSSGGTHAVLV